MSETVQDAIQKEIIINAPQQKVYEAITDPAKIVAWFPDAIEGTLKAGDSPILDFGEHGKNQIYVETATPYEYFSYRWIPGSKHFIGNVLDETNTLVEFVLEAVENGTKVTLKESGFATLPADVREQKFADNNGGWDYMLGRLNTLMADQG